MDKQPELPGLLKFFIFGRLYLAPICFVYTVAADLFQMLSAHPVDIFAILIFLVDTVISGFLVWRWILIAGHLQALQPNALKETKHWLILTLVISLGWYWFKYMCVFLMVGNVEDLLLGTVRISLFGLIPFALLYSYFSLSKAVKGLFPN